MIMILTHFSTIMDLDKFASLPIFEDDLSYCSCLKDILSKVKLERPSEGVDLEVSCTYKVNKSGSVVTSKLAVLTKGGGYLKQMSSLRRTRESSRFYSHRAS